MRSQAVHAPLHVRLLYYVIGWRPSRLWTPWAEAFVLSKVWPLTSTVRYIGVNVVTLLLFGSQSYSWNIVPFIASVMLLPVMVMNDRDIQRRREIARLRGLQPPPTPIYVLGPIVLLSILLLRSGIVVDERGWWIAASSLAAMITWMVIRNRRSDRLLPPLPSRALLFADD